MTVTSDVQSVVHDTDGSTVDFPIPFYFLRDTDVVVDLIDAAGNLQELVFGSDFTLAGAGQQQGGSLTTTTTYPAGLKLHAYRVVPATQESQYQQNDPFPAKTTEKALDKLTMLYQQANQTLDRALVVPRSDLDPQTTLPIARLRANKALGFDNAGNPFAIDLTIGSVLAPVVHSIAMLRLASRLLTSDVLVTGYYTAHDGGGGTYSLDPADTTSADNGGTIIVAADGGRWKLTTPGAVSLLQFGLKGGGSNENAALANAITVAATAGLVLYWPPDREFGFTNLSINVPRGIFNWSGTARLKQLDGRDPSSMALRIGGTVIADGLALAATSLSQTSSVTLSDASLVQPGDVLRLMTNRLAYGDHRFDANNAFGQLAKVKSVSGNTVQLADNIVFDLLVQPITGGTAQGGTAGTITLAAGDGATYHDLKNRLLTITGGTGAGQSRYIHGYDATTKVVDIGTTYTGFPQAPWATIPDSTSQYSVSATVSVRIIRPAYIKNLAGMKPLGYAQPSVDVYGVQVEFTDRAIIDDSDIDGFSHWALCTYQNYKPLVSSNRFAGANYIDLVNGGNGQINGFGHYSMGDFDCVVRNNTTENCHDGFESINGTVFLTRIGNTVRGGGMSYDGVTPMYPGTPTDGTSGISCHSGSFYVTDIGNDISDVYFNKQRGIFHTFQNNTIRGRSNSPVNISYSTGGIYTGNVYDDGMTNEPSTGMNGNVNGNEGLPINSNLSDRPAMFMTIRQNTMVEGASITVRNNVAKSLTQTFVYLDAISATSDLDLAVVDNDFAVVNETSEGVHVISADAGTINFRMLRAWGNLLRVGGAVFGTLKADNMSLYPILASLPTTASFVMQCGPSQFLAWLPANTLAQIAVPVGDQSTFRLGIFEKDSKLGSYFYGIVQRGNATPIAQFASSGIELRTDTPSAATGNDDINVFLRTDSLWINNKSATNCTMVVDVDSILS